MPSLPVLCLSSRSQTDTTGLHRWGAVTLFHGLPSDQVRAVAQDADGVMWFGTDAGLARYDGRRIQTLADDGLAGRRVLALRADSSGALWVGTDDGAYLRAKGSQVFALLAETKGKRVTAIADDEGGRAVLATADGLLFDCRRGEEGTLVVRQLGERLTTGRGQPSELKGQPVEIKGQLNEFKGQALELTSVALSGETVLVGTRGRGLLTIAPGGESKEVVSKPRAFFVESLERDASGTLFFGAQTSSGDGGVFRVDTEKLARPLKMTGATGTVTALASSPRGEVYAATDGRGVFLYRAGQLAEHFTFAGTAGGLRSDTVNAVFVDREGVAWFGTPRGVCRYDPGGVRVEQVASEAEGNFVRSIYRTSQGRLLAGTNRGLFARDDGAATWREVEEVKGKTVYSIAEDSQGLLLVGTGSGLYVGLQTEGLKPRASVKLAPEEKAAPEKSKRASSEESQGGADAGDEDSKDSNAKDGSAAAEDEKAAQAKGPAAQNETANADESEDGASEPSTKKATEPALSGSVRAIARFGDAVYVATFGRGLERFEGPGRRALVWPRAGDDERGREVVSLYADNSRGRLWIGTANAGVFYFDGGGVKKEPALSALESSTVWGASAANGWLWLATSRGLYAFRDGLAPVEVAAGVDARSVVAVTSKEAESNVSASSKEAGGGSSQTMPRAWCATAGAGVIRVALDEQFGPITSHLDAEQGLPTDNAFAVLSLPAPDDEGAADKNGEGASLLVGTTRGLARYEPSALAPVLKLARVTASRTFQPEEIEADALRLDYPQNSLVLDVAASASRTFPEQFQYAFTLRDARGKVIRRKLSHDSQFQVERLPAGSYSVTARAYTLDLTPSEPLVFNFEVARAPFPRTIVALSVLLALALVALLWAYFQHRRVVRSGEELREANSQLAAARLQLASEAEAERRRIARDLHDQTLADLRRLLLLTDEMQQQDVAPTIGATGATTGGTLTVAASVVDPAALRAEIEAISQEVRRICEDLSPSVLENVGFAAALEWALTSALAHMPAESKFAYDFDCDENLEERLRLAPGVQMQVYRIVQEAVSNVCRHAHASHVLMSVRLDEAGDFTLTLEDDGRGFDAGNKRALKGRGLAGIRARASLVEAEAAWRRREGGGTIFVLRKPAAGDNHTTAVSV